MSLINKTSSKFRRMKLGSTIKPESRRGSILWKKPEGLYRKNSGLLREKKETKNDSIFRFSKKPEVSRGELRGALKKSYVGSGLSAQERIRIEKEVLPQQVYGGNISKPDLKRGINKLHQKRFEMKTPQERAKIIKEINILKKLGKV